MKIGLGSTVGTTAHIVIDEAGTVTMPLQPAVLVNSAAVANVSGDGTVYNNANFQTEIFDKNADWNASSFVFTAPVTGSYSVSCIFHIGGNASDNTRDTARIVASNREIIMFDVHGYNISQPDPAYRIGATTLVDMDASDTFYMRFVGYNGSQVLDWKVDTVLSIHLVA